MEPVRCHPEREDHDGDHDQCGDQGNETDRHLGQDRAPFTQRRCWGGWFRCLHHVTHFLPLDPTVLPGYLPATRRDLTGLMGREVVSDRFWPSPRSETALTYSPWRLRVTGTVILVMRVVAAGGADLSVKKQEKLGCPAEHFEGLVPDEVIAAYTKLVAAGRPPKEEAADFLGDPQLVEELGKWGMAHIVPHTASSPPSYRAVSPDLALMGVLGVWQAKLAHQHKLVYDGYHRLVAAQAVPTMSTDQVPAHLVRVLTETDEITRVSMDLINGARRDYMTLETADTEMPITNDKS